MSAILSGALEHELKGLTDEIASVSRDAQAKKEAEEAAKPKAAPAPVAKPSAPAPSPAPAAKSPSFLKG